MKYTPKQLWAFHLLTDKKTQTVGYGGAAGGGKTWLGAGWLDTMCNSLEGSKWFIGRDSLKDTRESVLHSFRKFSAEAGFKNWEYKENKIIYNNGSEIEFLDLSYMPNKDPLYERFGSKEYTGGWIEEAGNVHPLAYDVLKSRVGRWYNEKYNLRGKILVTFNPKKNWIDRTFYRPWKKGEETDNVKFVRALYHDNPYLPKEYIENLHSIKDKATRERLLHGNFDYDDDPTALLDYDSILNMFLNDHMVTNPKEPYLIADIARFGSDKAIITVWLGWVLVEYKVFSISSTTQIQKCINAFRAKYQIPKTNCIADDDGVGGGVVDNCGILGFNNGAAAKDKGYYRLKDQCGYLLAENIRYMYIRADMNEELRDIIEEELGQLKTFDTDKDGKLRILPKVEIKQNIGRSPDWLDVFIMRMYFLLYRSARQNRSFALAQKLLG